MTWKRCGCVVSHHRSGPTPSPKPSPSCTTRVAAASTFLCIHGSPVRRTASAICAMHSRACWASATSGAPRPMPWPRWPVSNSNLAAARRWFAEELRYVSRVRSPSVIKAFASVAREHFAGAGPWRLLSPMARSEYWTTDDANPSHLYHDVLIAIDESRRLNNGQPSLWAFVYDQLDLKPGEHVVHIGIGTGYYTAILADIVGHEGHVTAVEIDAEIAGRARANLASSAPNVTGVGADGFTFRPERSADVIVVNAGVTHLSLTWLDALA